MSLIRNSKRPKEVSPDILELLGSDFEEFKQKMLEVKVSALFMFYKYIMIETIAHAIIEPKNQSSGGLLSHSESHPQLNNTIMLVMRALPFLKNFQIKI